MKVLIMGCGRVGSRLATMLDKEGHEVIILDTNAHAFRRLPSDFGGKKHVGNGIDVDVLERVGARGADAFVASTQGDNRNVMATQMAKHLFNIPRTLCRIYDPIREEIYNGLGLETISPTVAGADMFKERLDSAPGKSS
ncbi:MAG: TrkA family potassium uptake protein [Chloroflexi bacterium]|nr:TrkA family potassium uptake protein [Chloroflexota bacterium]